MSVKPPLEVHIEKMRKDLSTYCVLVRTAVSIALLGFFEIRVRFGGRCRFLERPFDAAALCSESVVRESCFDRGCCNPHRSDAFHPSCGWLLFGQGISKQGSGRSVSMGEFQIMGIDDETDKSKEKCQ